MPSQEIAGVSLGTPKVTKVKHSPPKEGLNVKPVKYETLPISTNGRKNNEPISKEQSSLKNILIRSSYDAAIRGFVRYAETFIDNNVLRVLYRLSTETARKISELSLINALEKRKVTKSDCVTGFLRALEHVPATALIEPNLFKGHFGRVLAGIGNMAIRFATRFGLFKIGALDETGLGNKQLLDDFTSRSLLRAVYVNSDSPSVSIGVRALEQFLINLNLHLFKPLSRLFPNFQGLLGKVK